MGTGVKRAREEEPMSLALSLTMDSMPTTSSADSASMRKRACRSRVVATSGEGEFVCWTCRRAFASYTALGGHRGSYHRARHVLQLGVGVTKAISEKKRSEERHGLELGVGVTKAIREKKRSKEKQSYECHICGLAFEMGQGLGGHMKRRREEMSLSGGGAAADTPPVLLELFV